MILMEITMTFDGTAGWLKRISSSPWMKEDSQPKLKSVSFGVFHNGMILLNFGFKRKAVSAGFEF